MGVLLAAKSETATKVWHLRSAVAQAEVFAIGGALHNLRFTLPCGTQTSPLAEAAWQGEYLSRTGSGQPRHIELLGGEWPCVPFGTTDLDPAHHGYGADNVWQVDEQGESHISLSIVYPKGHAIAGLYRRIVLSEEAPEVEITLGVTSARDCIVPIGVHPILKIPRSGNWTLVPGRYKTATTSPKPSHARTSQLLPDESICPNGHVGLQNGASANIWRAPQQIGDALIQIWNTDGFVELHDPAAGLATWVGWNADDLPHCLLWFANPGLSLREGDAGFRGLGVEPVHASFDGRGRGADDPIGVTLSAGQTWQTQYRIGCRSLPAEDMKVT